MNKMIRISVVALATMLPTGLLRQCKPPPPPQETWVWCGVHPDDAYAQAKANTLAFVAGIDAAMGPCLPPPSNYSPAYPGSRYMAPHDYLRTLLVHKNAGMKTFVYDARIWSTDPSVRNAAIEYWRPHFNWIRAWDMGDEFDPDGSEWPILVSRWNTVMAHVVPATGIGPFSNHLPWALDEALRDMPAHASHLSYDLYNVEWSLAIAREYSQKVNALMCAINGLNHGPYVATAQNIESAMRNHRGAGCDMFLVFGGDKPWSTPGFDAPSLVNWNGTPTPLAAAVARGAQP
jgi:hypothetical protein